MAEVHRDGVLTRVRLRLPDFRGALRQVAEQVLDDPAGTARSTIADLAERAGTSPATVTRFCRALGFVGYAELRLELASESGKRAERASDAVCGSASQACPGGVDGYDPRIRLGDPLERVFRGLIAADHRAIHETAVMLDLAEVERAAAAVADAGRVNLFGAGAGRLAAAELQAGLHRIGLAAWSWADVHNALAGAALLGPGDVLLAAAPDGRSREAIETLAEAGSHGATTVALTGSPRSPMAEVADVVLLAAVPVTDLPDGLRLPARAAQLLVLDLLCVAVAQRVFNRAKTPTH